MSSTQLLVALCAVGCALVESVVWPPSLPSIPTQKLPTTSSAAGKLPAGKKFVIVLRGQSFRYRNDTMGKVRLGCQDFAIDTQLSCSQSLVDKVIKPLEEHGNQVKILITDSISEPAQALSLVRQPSVSRQQLSQKKTLSDDSTGNLEAMDEEVRSVLAHEREHVALTPPGACHLTPLIEQTFNANSSYTRVAGTKYMVSTGQPWNIRNAVNFLKDTYGGVEGVQKQFDYVMVIRHDLQWVEDASDWQASFDKFNFFSRCETPAARIVGGDDCVWDTVHLMPSSLFGIFDNTLGAAGCFAEYDLESHNRFVGHGHGCFAPMRDALGTASPDIGIGFLTNQRHRVRGTTGVVDLVLPKWPQHPNHPELDSDEGILRDAVA